MNFFETQRIQIISVVKKIGH